jgi:pentatricopeptide repeat protein
MMWIAMKMIPRRGGMQIKRIVQGEYRLHQMQKQCFNNHCYSKRIYSTTNRITYSALIKAYAKKGNVKKIEKIMFQEMKLSNIKPNVFHYTMLMNACLKRKKFKKVETYYEQMQSFNVEPTVHTYNTLIHACGKNGGNVDEFVNEMNLDKNVKPDVVTYNTLIKIYGKKHGDYDKLLECFNEMKKNNIQPDIFTYNTLITLYAKKMNFSMVEKLVNDMQTHNTKPDIFTYNTLITLYAKEMNFSMVEKLLHEMNDLKPDVVIYNTLINLYEKDNDKVQKIITELESNEEIIPNHVLKRTLNRVKKKDF